MEKLAFNTSINAPREKVWNTLFSDDTYGEWTAPFCEGSRAETDWKKGSEVRFMDTGGSGMIAVIEEKIDNEFMSFSMLGEIRDGVEDRDSEQVQQWKGGHENYYLDEKNGGTELRIILEVKSMPKEMLGFFETAWPKALDKVKELAELTPTSKILQD